MIKTFKVQAVLTRRYEFEIEAENAAQVKDAALNQIGERLGICTSEWTIECTVFIAENRTTEKSATVN